MRKTALKGKERIVWVLLRNKAAAEIRKAVKEGKLPDLKKREIICLDCNKQRAVMYHHEDYKKPLYVLALCNGCHIRRGTNAPIIKKTEAMLKRTCPNCGSSQILYNKSRDNHWCRICGEEWPHSPNGLKKPDSRGVLTAGNQRSPQKGKVVP